MYQWFELIVFEQPPVAIAECRGLLRENLEMLKTSHCLLNELQRLNGTCRPASQNEMTRQEWDMTEFSILMERLSMGDSSPGRKGISGMSKWSLRWCLSLIISQTLKNTLFVISHRHSFGVSEWHNQWLGLQRDEDGIRMGPRTEPWGPPVGRLQDSDTGYFKVTL